MYRNEIIYLFNIELKMEIDIVPPFPSLTFTMGGRG
jgi:hypothetical protein